MKEKTKRGNSLKILVCMVLAITMISCKSEQKVTEAEVKIMVATEKSKLPVALDDLNTLYWKDISLNGKEIHYVYDLMKVDADIIKRLSPDGDAKKDVITALKPDPITKKLMNAGYTYKFIYFNGETQKKLYEFKLSKSDME